MTDIGARPSPGVTPTAHVNLARLVLAGLENATGGYSPVARQSPLLAHPSRGTSARVPTEYLATLWQLSLSATDQPWLGLKAASQWRFGQLRLADYMFQSAPTAGEAILGMMRFSELLNTAPNAIRLAPDERGDATLTYQVRSGNPEVDAMASQFSLGVVLLHLRHATGREIRPLHLGLPTAAPPRHGELFDLSGAGRIDFGTDLPTMTLAHTDLALALPDADPALSAVLQELAASRIAALRDGMTWTERLRMVVLATLAEGGPSLPAAARRLSLSPRTLQRRLNEEGTNWQEVVDQVRRDRAGVLLARGLSRTAVAVRLGFSDARALRGALRRWRRDFDV